MLMGRLPGAPLAPGLENLLALDPALFDLLIQPAPWRRPGPLTPYGPEGLPAMRAPQPGIPGAPDSPAAAPLSALMQRLAPVGRDGTTGGHGRSIGLAPAGPAALVAPVTSSQRARHATANVGGATVPAGAAWEGIPVNFPRARGLEDAAMGIFTAPLTMAAPPGVGLALSIAKEAMTPPERQFRSLGPHVPGVPQTSQAMRAHWQSRGAIDAAGGVIRGGALDPDGNGLYDSPAYRGQWDFSVGEERSPWRQLPGGTIGQLVNAATGEIRRASSVAKLAARARAVSAAPPVAAGRVGGPGATAPRQRGGGPVLSSHVASAATRANVAAQLARLGGSAASAFAQRNDGGKDRGGGAVRSGAGSGSARGGLGPRGRQGAR